MKFKRFLAAAARDQTRPPGWWLFLVMLFAALSLASCGGAPPKSRRASPDWSRGVMVGQYAAGSIGMATQDAGPRVHIVWPRKQQGEIRIRYLQLDEHAGPIITTDLDTPGGAPRAPRLKPATEGFLHLFWASRPGGEVDWDLWHAFLDVQDASLSQVTKISPEDINVGHYVVASDGAGGSYVAWSAQADGSLNYLRLDRSGDVITGPTQLVPQSEDLAIQVDESGTLHAVWTTDSTIQYTTIPEARGGPGEVTPIAQLALGTGDALTGLTLGFSEGWVYVLWSITSQSGLTPGEALTAYVAFPSGSPRSPIPERLWLWPSEEQTYESYEGDLSIESLADPGIGPYGSDWVEEPVAVEGTSGSMASAITVRQQFRLDSFLQIGLLVFEEGRFRGYEIASMTESISQSPAITLDQAGQMHMAWREGAGSDRIYYATTASDARAALDVVSWGEVMSSLAVGSLEAFSGLAFFPLAFFWQVPGLIVMAILDFKRRQRSLRDPFVIAGLVVSLIVFNLLKLLLLPTIPTHVPFSAWIELPQSLELLTRISVPLAILLIGILVALWIRKKREIESNALFFLILATTDTVLTLAIYGVVIMGA